MESKETFKTTVEELKNIVYEDSAEFKLIKSEITGTFRHGNDNEAIVQRLSDNKFFIVEYRDSVKEMVEFDDINYEGIFNEVFPVEKTIIVYE